MIELKNVTVKYKENQAALHDVSLKIEKGEFVFIVGKSGAGKSTLIKLLLREILPSKGEVTVSDLNTKRMRRKMISKLRKRIGVVFQDFRLLGDRNIYDNVAFAQEATEVPAAEIPGNVRTVLKMVNLEDRMYHMPQELSGGEQQRAAVARALVNIPPVLLADEPTGNLDPKNSVEIMRLLERINRIGTTVVVVTHNTRIVNKMNKRVIELENGRVVRDAVDGYFKDRGKTNAI
ncbi:MAG: cell division ATP-binding protein FtsE [Eubacteriales bacterium]|nr:cell division ATP-binding protein FtsE [Eubacteriales bacterium]